MNALRNKVQLIGNLGNDPVITEFENGKKKARLSVATNDTYRNSKGELVKDTQWHTVVAWGKLAETMGKYLQKGSEVAIEGKLQTHSYEDSNGVKKVVTEVTCSELLMIGSKQKQPGE